jgi:phosphomannomutase
MAERDAIERWIADDPDPAARAELRALLDRGATGELETRFAGGLTFGTAGLRGALGAGPTRMNVATVRRATAGLAAHLLEAVDGAASAGIVIGHDARHGSARFAQEAAAVCSGAGLRTLRLPARSPTPLLAFAVRHLRCAAGVMVTASHNPAGDNGYKVYLGDGAQIAPPADERIAAAIDAVGRLADVPLGDGGEQLGDEIAQQYLGAIVRHLPHTHARDLRIVYTPLHGVGAGLALRAFAHAGFAPPHVVAEQAEPDPDFPTAPRPNPEEDGVLDLALAAAEREGADVVLANDPDADRLAVAIPAADGGWRRLHGDETGALLADFLLEHTRHHRERLLITTVASSSLLARMANAAGAGFAETLTGFKWIMRAAAEQPERPLLLGYEEALGYAVSDVVRDKDGISAALAMAQLAAGQRARGETLEQRLDAIAERYGRHATEPLTLVLEGADGLARMRAIMDRVRAHPPGALLGREVVAIEDLRDGVRLPPSDVLIIHADGARVVIRPSGTEPKLKAYLEVVVDGDRTAAADALARLRAEVAEVMVERRPV